MLQAKRKKLHQEVRRQHWNRLFETKRKLLLEGGDSTIKDLYRQINDRKDDGIEQDIINRLLKCLQMNPNQQNTYIVLSNYLNDHNQAYIYFYQYLVDNPMLIENHTYCLFLLANIIFQQYNSANQPLQNPEENKLNKILICSTRVCEQMTDDKKNLNLKRKFYAFFEEIFKLALFSTVPIWIEDSSILLFTKILHFYGSQQTGQQNLIGLIRLIQIMCKKWQIMTTISTSGIFIRQTFKVIMMGLKKLSKQRQPIIEFLNKMLYFNTSSFMKTYYNETFVNEILYYFNEVCQLKPQIVKLLINLVAQTEFSQLPLFLNSKVHIYVTRCLEWSMDNRNNQCLEDCLLFIYRLLNRLNQYNETHLIHRILRQISCENFDLIILGLVKNEQNDGIKKVLNNLIDDFYEHQQVL